MFESQDRSGEGGGPVQNATDKRYVESMGCAGEEWSSVYGIDWGRLNGRVGLTCVRDRFFWLALYAQPGLWVGLAIFALVRLESPIWLSLNGRGTLFYG